MPKVNFAHLCNYASLDNDGRVNIVGIFEAINALEFPFRHPQIYVVVSSAFEKAGSYKEEVNLLNSNGDVIVPLSFDISVTEKSNAGVIGQMTNIDFATPGIYKIQIKIDGKSVLDIPLPVEKISN